MGPILPGGEVALGQSPIKSRPCPFASGQCSGQDADGAEGVGGQGAQSCSEGSREMFWPPAEPTSCSGVSGAHG